MPKPFPYPLSVGTDICSISRIFGIITKNDGHKANDFIVRILRQSERTQLENRLNSPLGVYVRAVRMNAITEWKVGSLTGSKRVAAAKQLRSRFFSNKPPPAWFSDAVAAIRKLDDLESVEQGREVLQAELDSLRDWKLEKTFGLVASPWDALLKDLQGGKSIRDTFDDARNTIKATGDSVATRRKANGGTQLEKDIQTWIQEAIWKEEDHTAGTKSDEGLPREGEDSSVSEELLQLNKKTRDRLKFAKTELKAVAQLLAGRFAAKEAVIKAHPSVRLTYSDITIYQPPKTDQGSQPPIAIIMRPGVKMADAQEAKISISHDEDFATAVCLAVNSGTPGGHILIPRRVAGGGLPFVGSKNLDLSTAPDGIDEQ